MPGFELLGQEELNSISEIFTKSNGVLYSYGLDARRNNIFRCREFENQVANIVGVKYALYVNTGTAALKIALIAMGVGQGDEVITQGFTFVATVEAILELGAIPIITEIDDSYNMDPKDLTNKITSKTKVIIPVHMAGSSVNMDEIMRIAKEKNIAVLEDSAQAFGASYKETALGTIGDAGVYSFDIGKLLTTGEGGVLVTNDEKIYRLAKEYTDHGHENNPNFSRGKDTRTTWGFNYKVTELQAAVGLAQLKKMDFVLETQRMHKAKIMKALEPLVQAKFRVHHDKEGEAGDTIIFKFQNSDEALRFAAQLGEAGIGTKNLPDAVDWHFAVTWDHMLNKSREALEKELPYTTDLMKTSVSVPIMLNIDIDEIVSKIKNIVQNF